MAPPQTTEAPRTAAELWQALEGLLQLENRQPVVCSPSEVTLSERTAVGILCRHYGWTVIEPGTLRRPR